MARLEEQDWEMHIHSILEQLGFEQDGLLLLEENRRRAEMNAIHREVSKLILGPDGSRLLDGVG